MIRAVLDTNVLVSAALIGGLPRRILLRSPSLFVHVTSAYVLEEYRRACIHKLGMDHRRVDRSAAFIVSSAEVIPLFHALRSWCDEPGDDAIVETAVVGKVDFLVTGDRVLLDSCIDVVRVVTPRAFADTLGIE